MDTLCPVCGGSPASSRWVDCDHRMKITSIDEKKVPLMENKESSYNCKFVDIKQEEEVVINKSRAVGKTETLNLQAAVNDAVAKAGNVPVKTAKRIEKEKKQEEAYWKSMITREEARTMVLTALGEADEKLRMLYITTSTLIQFVLDKGLATQEELDSISRPIAQALYGFQDEDHQATPVDEQPSNPSTVVGD